MKELTMGTLNEAHEIIRSATALVANTHDGIDLCWLRANNTIEGRKKMLLYIVNGIDDDIRILLDILPRINSWDSGINKACTSRDGLMSSPPTDNAPPVSMSLCRQKP